MTEKNYRHAVDPFLLADFIRTEEDTSVADLGTGNGIIPILLHQRFPTHKITGFEIQKNLAFEAGKTIHSKKLHNHIQIVCCDIRDYKKLFKAGTFNLIVGNPPYRRANDGRINKNISHAIARHELKITIKEYVSACSRLVTDGGKIALIYHPNRMTEMLAAMKEKKIAPLRIRFVHSGENEEACMFLLEGVSNGKNDLIVEKPLYIYKQQGVYSDEMVDIYTRSGFPPQNPPRI